MNYEGLDSKNLVPDEVAGNVREKQVCISLGADKREFVNDKKN